MKETITLELRTEDAEPILREAAHKAALNGGRWLYVTRQTYHGPWNGTEGFNATSRRWHQRYLEAERLVEAFGVEAEVPSEGETLTAHWPEKVLRSHPVKVAGITWRHIDESVPDPKREAPAYRGGVHEEACRQAAERVVRRWRALAREASAA